MDPWRLAPFLLVASTIWASMVLFVGWRLLGHAPRWAARTGGLALGASACTVPVAFLLFGAVGTPWVDAFHVVAFLCAGVIATLFFSLLARDGLGWVVRGADRVAGGPLGLADPERRRLLTVASNGLIVAATGIITGVGHANTRRVAEVVTVDVPIPGLPDGLDGFRIAQISDLHVGPTIRSELITQIVARVNELSPDLVALTGDLVDGPVDVLRPHVAPLAELVSTHGTYFVTGNHEYYSGAEPWIEHVRSLGMRALIEGHHVVWHNASPVLIAGVSDLSAHRMVPSHTCDPDAACAGAPEARLRILLAHQPNTVDRVRAGSFDLQLSGHTHGGQFVPFTWLISMVQRYSSGLHLVRGMWLYVNRGTTWWGPPIRLGAPQEITLLVLRAVGAPGAR